MEGLNNIWGLAQLSAAYEDEQDDAFSRLARMTSITTLPSAGLGRADACPQCEHTNAGTQRWESRLVRRFLHLRPKPTCPADDGMGGGFEHDGRCGCPHAFHS